jgi:predicted ATP-binding protein involved in virulence
MPDQQNEKRIAAIAKLYDSGEIANEDQVLLRYFLGRLGSVIEKTKETEAMLQRFVEACNSYLSESSEEKLFTYDPNLMRVAVINSWTEKEIPLSQLSSGEKQIVSILAKLYLYEKQKLVLIDEPELSLSIDWQRRILPDMLKSGSVCQLLAITHSPFVFDNDLDPYAGALSIDKRRAEPA